MTALSRAAPVLERAFRNLPPGPLLLKLSFEGVIGDIDGEVKPIGYDEALAQLSVNSEPDRRPWF